MNSDDYILIAEDSPTQAEQLSHILKQNFANVKIAKNGLEALMLLKEEKPLIIISDIIMPKMDGFQLCKMVKNDPDNKNIPFIILTSLADPHDVIKGLQAGADNFLTKPYNEQFLMSRIQYIIANQTLRKGMISGMGMEIAFAGQRYFINSDRMQIVDLLLSTYENAMQKNMELTEANIELTEMQHELEIKNMQLEKLDAEKNKFLGMAAHDIRNPLSSILGAGMLLELELSDKIDKDNLELLYMIKESAAQVMTLINELLDISVIESGNLNLSLEEVNLAQLIVKNLSSYKMLADKKGIKINFTPESDLPQIAIDQSKIEQVMNNLVSNAIKFSFSDKVVKISISKVDDYLEITVKDEGQGIPEEEIGKLFKPFPKISVTATSGEASTGLGLSIVKKIVEAHNGKVFVKSKVDYGTTFYVQLPIINQ